LAARIATFEEKEKGGTREQRAQDKGRSGTRQKR
jgi:hypothetical protein